MLIIHLFWKYSQLIILEINYILIQGVAIMYFILNESLKTILITVPIIVRSNPMVSTYLTMPSLLKKSRLIIAGSTKPTK